MPWTPAQHRLFEAAAHDPTVARARGISHEDAARMAHEGIKRMADGGWFDDASAAAAQGMGAGAPSTPEEWQQAWDAAKGAARGWVAGVGGIPNSMEEYVNQMNQPVAGPPTHVFPDAPAIARYLPGRDLGPAGKIMEQGGQTVGGLGLGVPTALAGMGKLSEVMPRGSAGSLGTIANQAGAIKPKGGNWAPWQLEQYLDNFGPHVANGNMTPTEVALQDWKNKQLARYLKTYLGTKEDPLLQLEQQGQLHLSPEQLQEASRTYGLTQGAGNVAPQGMYRLPSATWSADEGEGTRFHREATGRDYRTHWENLSDAAPQQYTAKEVLGGIHDQTGIDLRQQNAVPMYFEPDLRKQYDWLTKDPAQKVYDLGGQGDDPLGFSHVLDYLRQSGMTPEQLSRVSVPDAVRATAAWNAKNAGIESDKLIAARKAGITATHTEYPSGYAWHQLGPDALDAEGKMMGHCVGSYCENVKNRGTQIYSLSDPQGVPHATVEVRPGQGPTPLDKHYDTLSPEEQDDIKRSARLEPGDAISNRKPGWVSAQYVDSIKAELQRRYPEISDTTSPDIVQIKGKQNAAPVAQYQPYVQDFVKNGNWGQVRDLQNTGLYDVSKPEELSNLIMQSNPDVARNGRTTAIGRAKAAGAFNGQRFMSREEWENAIAPHLPPYGESPQDYNSTGLQADWKKRPLGYDAPPEGHALGGPIKMGNIRSAPSAPTINDPAIAHVHRITGQKFYPLKFAQGGEVQAAQDDVALHNHIKYVQGVLNNAAY
jgi:hypothetical protein